ncbi:MAG: c-type cytochrome [Candidatus Omnitrophica bacterium]|nr:c-type cytochrome [Candidatus Omnitrophota bacterium]
MKKTLLISSLIIISVLLFEAYHENIGNEWYRYQKKYKDTITKLAKTKKERDIAASYEIKMRQIVLPDLRRVDRCISCHVGIEDPRMAGMEQPLAAHPGDTLEIHELETIGCTVCHDGQGRAITVKEAHAVNISFWEKPMLKEPFLQSNCFRCHNMDELPQLAEFHEGRKIFFSHGCLGCHKLKGKGGQLGPDLTNIADANIHLKHPVNKNLVDQFYHNLNVAYIYESVKEPKAQPEVTAMPDFHFSEEEIRALTVFLKSLSKRAVPASYLAQKREGHQPEDFQGEALFRKYCVACHGIDAKGGVKNINYVKKTVPALNTLAERMFLTEPEDANKVAELLEKGVDITNMSPQLDVPNRGRVLAQYRAIRNVIEKGSIAGKEDPKGPEPLLHMPSWAEGLTRKDIDSIISCLIKLYPWDEKKSEENNE